MNDNPELSCKEQAAREAAIEELLEKKAELKSYPKARDWKKIREERRVAEKLND